MVSPSIILPKAAVKLSISLILFFPLNIPSHTGTASGPLTRIIPMADLPIPVATAQIVSVLYMSLLLLYLNFFNLAPLTINLIIG